MVIIALDLEGHKGTAQQHALALAAAPLMHWFHLQDVDQELSGMATLCCDAVAEGLRRVKPTSAIDVREGFHMQRNILHTVLKLHHRITTGLVTAKGPALGTALGPPALEVVMAGFEATMELQDAVLCPEALTSGLGGLAWLSHACALDRALA